MNLKQTLAGITLALAVSGTTVAQASETLQNFHINTAGTGFVGSTLVNDFIDLTGSAFVHNTFTSASEFDFNEAARFIELTADGETILDPFLRATFTGTGTGSTSTQVLSFTPGGTLTLATEDSTPFATFTLSEGSANLAANSTLPQGTVSLIFTSASLQPGYFFLANGTDLSTVANANLLFGFSTTNALAAANGTRVSSSLISLYNSAFSPDVTAPIFTNGTTDVQFSTNGQFRIGAVPVPAAFWLLGSGLAGLMTLAKRKKLAA